MDDFSSDRSFDDRRVERLNFAACVELPDTHRQVAAKRHAAIARPG
jgi:hypothetical protein